jgi:hypothetical protein
VTAGLYAAVVLLPPAVAWVMYRVTPRAYGFGGRCVVHTACAAGMLAICVQARIWPAAACAAVSMAVPWLQWVPWWQRRRHRKRMARLGGAHEQLQAYERRRRLRLPL